MTDPWKTLEGEAWVRAVLDDMLPKLSESAAALSIVPDGVGDVKLWVELGAAIMLDKPIVAVVFGDRPIPERLIRVADDIVRIPEDADDKVVAREILGVVRRVVRNV